MYPSVILVGSGSASKEFSHDAIVDGYSVQRQHTQSTKGITFEVYCIVSIFLFMIGTDDLIKNIRFIISDTENLIPTLKLAKVSIRE